MLQPAIKQFLEERGWDKLKPADLAKSISIESAELLELFQWSDETLEEVKNNPEKLEKIKKELADVFIYALQMSALLDFDTEKIILDKLDYISKKYPAELMKARKDHTQPGTDDLYLKIKNDYRRKGIN